MLRVAYRQIKILYLHSLFLENSQLIYGRDFVVCLLIQHLLKVFKVFLIQQKLPVECSASKFCFIHLHRRYNKNRPTMKCTVWLCLCCVLRKLIIDWTQEVQQIATLLVAIIVSHTQEIKTFIFKKSVLYP